MEKVIKDIFNDEILKKALEYYGFKEDEIVDKAGFESFIFEIKNKNNDYILRISHSSHREANMIKAEIDFIDYLSLNKANVSTPVKSINNHLVEKIQLDDGTYFSTTVFIKALGGMVKPNQHSEELFEILGEAIANLHLLAKDFKPENQRKTYFDDSFIMSAKKYIPEDKKYILKKYQELLAKIESHPRNLSNYGLCHTDLHFSNMFVTEDLKITFFDFDDSLYTHYAFDVAIVFFYFIVYNYFNSTIKEKNKAFSKYYKAFMKGYNRKYHISKDDLILIKYYLIARAYDLYAVYNRSFDVKNNVQAQMITDYFLKIIEGKEEIFDYNLIF